MVNAVVAKQLIVALTAIDHIVTQTAGNGVVVRQAVQGVVAVATFDVVIAKAAGDAVIAVVAKQLVVALVANDLVVAGSPGNGVVACGARDQVHGVLLEKSVGNPPCRSRQRIEPFSTSAEDKGFRWGAGHFGPGINQLREVIDALFREVVE